MNGRAIRSANTATHSVKAKVGAQGVKLVIAGGLALVLGARAANATVYSEMPGVSFASSSAQIDLGASRFIFTDIPNTPLGNPPAAVSTNGGGEVSSLLGGVADFGAGATIDQNGELYGFSSFASPTVIPYSAADDFIGLAFTLADGVHYGYAEVDGTELVSYGFESLPDTTIVTGTIPEPATMALFGTAIVGLAVVGRRRRTAAPAPRGAVAKG